MTSDDGESEAQESALGGEAGQASLVTCTPVDTADTVCDHVDEDCDGHFDEDCDFGPSSCPSGSRVIRGTRGNDTLIGTSGRDCILGFGGNDTISGSSGDDTIAGGPGNDTISGGSNNDRILGGSGADVIDGGSGNDVIDGGDGNDRIEPGSGNDNVHGGMCHDSINGTYGDDLHGDDGSDRINALRLFNHVNGGNGIDACSGTSCEVSLSVRACTRDTDCSGGRRCVIATGICALPTEVSFTDTTCNGVDDDCNGRFDEDFVGGAMASCGTGVCASTGTAVCSHGHVEGSCVPNPPTGNDANCNAVDEDCDGHSDEHFSGTSTCGVGACMATGTATCSGGMMMSSCTPGTPAANDASCNGVDNDCDTRTDEDFAGTSVSCGVGACAATGTTTCSGGSVHNTCTPGNPAANDSSCNGVDDDCSGASDEDFAPMPTNCGVGACAATGVTSCSGGHVNDSCHAGGGALKDDVCDGIDGDCDGNVDEDYGPELTTCGVGACAASGVTSCVGGHVQDSCHAGTAAGNDASCNGTDDDCNGQTDEDFASTATSCGIGACSATGATSCVGGSVHDSCVEHPAAANDSLCNGRDDDCNGQVDEDYVSSMTSCGIGACASMGATSCVGGTVQNSCTPGEAAPSDFTCDGIDDDCNGERDEDYSPHATTCGTGSCGANGVSSCVLGHEQDNCSPGDPSGTDPTCDGFDDDCDGDVDEDYAPMATSCGIGACAAAGATACVSGEVEDTCTPGMAAANDATCNGIDEDCSGVADEDFVPTCSGGSGRNVCLGGVLTLQQCSDGNACNGAESCDAGVCNPGTPVVTSDGDACTTDSCDPSTGTVSHTPVAPGSSCSDGNVCNGAELCQISAGAPGCSSGSSGTIAWWPGEGTAEDIQSGFDGTLMNGATFAAGEVAQAFSLDGTNDHINVDAHADGLNLAGTATIELWIRSNADTCRTIFNLRQDRDHEQFLQLGNGCNGTLTNEILTWSYVNLPTSSVVGVTTSNRAVLLDNNWHHVAVTFDGTVTRMYFDGVAQTVTIAAGTNHGDWGGFPTAPVIATIGARNTGTALSGFFRGGMDEVTIYDHALSAAEIAGIVIAGPAGKCTGTGALTCTSGTPAPPGTACDSGGMCDGAGTCL